MTGLSECFTKKQQMYYGNKSQLLKTFDPTPSFTPSLKKDAPILDFSVIVNSQAAVITVKTFNEFADGIIKFVQNLFSGCSPIDTVCDSYFLKSHTRQTRRCGKFFSIYRSNQYTKQFLKAQ